jgi:hypothetical protein
MDARQRSTHETWEQALVVVSMCQLLGKVLRATTKDKKTRPALMQAKG